MQPGIKKYKWQGLNTAPLISFKSWKGLSNLLNTAGAALVPPATPERERFVQKSRSQHVRQGHDVDEAQPAARRRSYLWPIVRVVATVMWLIIKFVCKRLGQSMIGWGFATRDLFRFTVEAIRIGIYGLSECRASYLASNNDRYERDFGRQSLLRCAAQLRRRKNRFMSPGSRLAKMLVNSLDEALTTAIQYGDLSATAAAQLLNQQATSLEIDIVDPETSLPDEFEQQVVPSTAVTERPTTRPIERSPILDREVTTTQTIEVSDFDEPPAISFENDDSAAEEVREFLQNERQRVPQDGEHDGYR